MTEFEKPRYHNVEQVVKNLSAIAFRADRLPGLLKGKPLSAAFRERLMLVITSVNHCRYCEFIHDRAAAISGVSSKEIESLAKADFSCSPPDEILALQYAHSWAKAGGKPDETLRLQMRNTYGRKLFRAIELSMAMIYSANLFGNSFDHLLARFSSSK